MEKGRVMKTAKDLKLSDIKDDLKKNSGSS